MPKTGWQRHCYPTKEFLHAGKMIHFDGGAAMQLFTVIEEALHHVGDVHCPGCLEEYPGACGCGGLMHGEGEGPEGEDGSVSLRTRCDQCGRSQEDIEEDLGREPA